MEQRYSVYEDIASIPYSMVRERQDMIRHLQSMHTAGVEVKIIRLQDLIKMVQGLPALHPKYHDMNLEKRMKSLIKFAGNVQTMPEDHDHLQMIALGGFFYCGNGSALTCYHCGCSAIDWKTDDDPWIRHAELQPNCPVIRRRVSRLQDAGGPSYTILRRSASCPELALCEEDFTDESLPVTLIAVTA